MFRHPTVVTVAHHSQNLGEMKNLEVKVRNIFERYLKQDDFQQFIFFRAFLYIYGKVAS